MTTPRLATPVDAGEIARLRSELILSQPLDASWITTGQDLLAARLQPGGDARAYVIDAPDGTLATCALGLVHCVLPARRYPKGLAVRIHAVATDRPTSGVAMPKRPLPRFWSTWNKKASPSTSSTPVRVPHRSTSRSGREQPRADADDQIP